MKRGLLILGLASVAGAANAVLVVGVSQTAFENFDGLPGTTQTAYFSATVGVQSVLLGTTFDGTKIGGTGTAGMNLIADDGTSNSGAVRSLFNTGSAEKAAGMLASGTNIAGIGVEILNNSGSAWSSLTIAFTQENWRSSTTTQNVMAASWSTSAAAASYLTTGTFSSETALDLVGPAAVTTNGALNGNDPLNQAARSATLTFSAPVASGSSVFVRWLDLNDAGNDAALAIDNFEVSATAVPEPATMAVLGLGAAALLRRRSRK